MKFNLTYNNQTVNKAPLPNETRWLGVCWHETASPNPENPHGTLQYNLMKDSSGQYRGSYHYLISRSGECFQYIDPRLFVSFNAGVRSSVFLRGKTYRGGELNYVLIGVELDGKNDGAPATSLQIEAAARLMVYLRDEFGVPLDRGVQVSHRDVAPGYKTDPRGYSVDVILDRARQIDSPARTSEIPIAPLFQQYWKLSSNGAIWNPDRFSFGRPLSRAFPDIQGNLCQVFERGVIRKEGLQIQTLLIEDVVRTIGTFQVVSPPRIDQATWYRHLQAVQSPIAEFANLTYGILSSEGIDPTFAFAVWYARTQCDAKPIQPGLFNPGLVSTPYRSDAGTIIQTSGGTLVKYPDYDRSVHDWAERIRIRYVKEGGLRTPQMILPTYLGREANQQTLNLVLGLIGGLTGGFVDGVRSRLYE